MSHIHIKDNNELQDMFPAPRQGNEATIRPSVHEPYRGPGHSPGTVRRPSGCRQSTSLLLLLAVVAIVLFTMLRSPLKDDVAWLLYVARRWLAGRELYIDVVEINPPLIVWISAIPM